MSLESQSLVVATLEGYGPLGVFQTKTGGNADSEEVKDAPGGMGPETALGGRQVTENVTIGRRYIPERDGPLKPILRNARGKRFGHLLTITVQPLDSDRNPVGPPDVFTGPIKAFNAPDADSNSSDKAMFEIEQSTDAQVG